MSTGCKSSHNGFLDVSRSNGGLISVFLRRHYSATVVLFSMQFGEKGNLHLGCPPCEYVSEYLNQGKVKIPPADRITMDSSHKARKDNADNANLDFQAVGPALHIMQLNVEGLSAAKRSFIQSLAEKHHIDVICFQKIHVHGV